MAPHEDVLYDVALLVLIDLVSKRQRDQLGVKSGSTIIGSKKASAQMNADFDSRRCTLNTLSILRAVSSANCSRGLNNDLAVQSGRTDYLVSYFP